MWISLITYLIVEFMCFLKCYDLFGFRLSVMVGETNMSHFCPVMKRTNSHTHTNRMSEYEVTGDQSRCAQQICRLRDLFPSYWLGQQIIQIEIHKKIRLLHMLIWNKLLHINTCHLLLFDLHVLHAYALINVSCKVSKGVELNSFFFLFYLESSQSWPKHFKDIFSVIPCRVVTTDRMLPLLILLSVQKHWQHGSGLLFIMQQACWQCCWLKRSFYCTALCCNFIFMQCRFMPTQGK